MLSGTLNDVPVQTMIDDGYVKNLVSQRPKDQNRHLFELVKKN